MVNLLFISNSTKIDSIRAALQPFLKVKIDVVADFDFGLKDVFEKRPATVFIQDQIAGVTGESVARHIQMLLGSGSPLFIFLHEANPKAKPIKGLFEYLVDLSQADQKVVDDIQATLKSLLGPQWEKIYISPKVEVPVISEVLSVPEEKRVFADQLVDDFLSDLEKQRLATIESRNPTSNSAASLNHSDDPFQVVSTPHDQLSEMLAETGRVRTEVATAVAPTSTSAARKASVGADVAGAAQQKQQVVPSPKRMETVVPPDTSVFIQQRPAQKAVSAASAPQKKVDSNKLASSDLQTQREVPILEQTSPADFVIVGERPVADVAPEDLLRVFEGNLSSHSGSWKRYVTIAVVLALSVGGYFWYLQKPKLHIPSRVSKPFTSSAVTVPAVVQPVPSSITDPKPDSPPARKAAAPPLPSFIPQSGLDSSFASQKPGWERYVDTSVEYRVYRLAGKIKALQVLGLKNEEISESRMKSILSELLGNGDVNVKSSEQKLGYHVSRATVGQNAELLIYRKKSTVRAFVVSLD